MRLLAILALTALAACTSQNAFDESDYNSVSPIFEVICLDGVEYWVRATGYHGYLAVRIDPETLQPRRCKM